MRKLSEVEAPFLRSEPLVLEVGDTVDVGVIITETVEKRGKQEEKERIQIFNGVVIARGGAGINDTFTVRRIVSSEGVERVFPIHSPKIAHVTVKRKARVRRAKLYYLRDRAGKSARLRERIVTTRKKTKGAPKGK